MDEIIFQRITSTPDGVLATSGRLMERAFNENFDAVKFNLDTLFSVASIQVSSSNVTQLKIDTSVTPYAIYYSLDELSEEEPEWHLLTSTFSNLVGSPEDHILLKQILDSKASTVSVDGVSAIVSSHTSSIGSIQSTVAGNVEDIGNLQGAVSTLQSSVQDVVTTPSGHEKFILRYNSLNGLVEFSLDNGTSWTNLSVTKVDWEDIIGDAEDNQELTDRVNALIYNSISSLATREQLLEHTTDTNNPHNITKETLGLDKVDNISISGVLDNVATFQTTNLESYLSDSEFFGFAVIGSSFLDLPIGTYVLVETLEENDSYTGPDDVVIGYYTDTSSLPDYYSVDDARKDEDGVRLVYFNQRMYDESISSD